MYKLNFKLSLNTYTNINRYASSLNLPLQTVMRFLLSEQIIIFNHNTEIFDKNYNHCKPKETMGTIDAYGNEVPPKSYSMEVSEFIHDGVENIQTEYGDKKEIVVNNLLHIGIAEKLSNFESIFATPYTDIKPKKKQYSIPLSISFTERLQDISKITGIKVNQLISLIIGNYLIEHYAGYDEGVYYNSQSGKYYYDVW